MRKDIYRVVILSLVVVFGSSSCGGGGGGNPPSGGNGTVDPSITVKQAALPIGDSHCPTGGAQIDVGIDTNGNGILDPAEVTRSEYVCNGADGLTTLVTTTTEPAGAHCLNGGILISSGTDTNKNSKLDSSEVTATQYVCDGANGASGSGISWVDVTGTSIQAVVNTGYMANSSSPVTITLPTSGSLNLGDIVQVSGFGSGGWKIAQNAGQTIITKDMLAFGPRAKWAPSYALTTNWSSIASSADGTMLTATVMNGDIYISRDSGATWLPMGAGPLPWSSVAMSSDGTKGVALLFNGGINGGIATTWNSGMSGTITSAPAASWQSVAISADATKIVAAISGGGIYTSPDFGGSWTVTSAPTNSWTSVASSSDGSKLVAASTPSGIYTSSNSGGNWTLTSAPTNSWSSVASSSDGSKLVATSNPGGIYTSSDSGGSWTLTSAPTNSWSSVASSSDGTSLVAVTKLGGTYMSVDSGGSWTRTSAPAANFVSVASSSDGGKLVACANGGWIHRMIPSTIYSTSVGTSGFIKGQQYDAIELQYTGNDTFMVLSHEGTLMVY